MARTKKLVNPDSFYTVYSWMPIGLGLSGSKLLVYAFIYAYSTNESGKGCYFGGYEAISQSTGCATRSVMRAVQELSANGLIEIKQVDLENSLKRNYYRIKVDPLLDLQYSVSTEKAVKIINNFSDNWDDIEKHNSKVKRTRNKKEKPDRVF